MLKEVRFSFENELVYVNCDCLDFGDGTGPQRVGPFGFHAISDADQRKVICSGRQPVILYRVAEDTTNLGLFRNKAQVCWVIVEGSVHTNKWSGRILDSAEAAQLLPATRKRRAGKPPKPRPLTARQTEVIQIVGNCNGNIAKAAKRLGLNRKTVDEAYRAGMGKLGKTVVTSRDKTRLLARDRRGQCDLSEDDDKRS
jgi:hypothetical protein